MSTRYIAVSIYPVLDSGLSSAHEALTPTTANRRLFRSLERSDILELEAFDDLRDIAVLETEWDRRWTDTRQFLAGDVRRQIVRFVEAPKDCATPLPQTEHVQLRYVEVKPPQYDDYRKWRNETIFSVVRSAPEVDVFLAYHTLVSTQPGVLFISGFSSKLQEYQAVFQSDRYRDIVQQAGDSYITGGKAGLSTQIFQSMHHDKKIAA